MLVFTLEWPCSVFINDSLPGAQSCKSLYTQIFKSFCIDVIQGHHRYYTLTGRALYGGSSILLRDNVNVQLRLHPRTARGVLLALDYPLISDPILLASCTPSKPHAPRPKLQTPRDMIQVALTSPESQAHRYSKELEYLLQLLTGCMLPVKSICDLRAGRLAGEDFITTPTLFLPFATMVQAWIQPLWRLHLDQKRTGGEGITYEQFMHVIRQDVGPGELLLNAALLLPLPLPTAAQPQLAPAFECLVQVKCVQDFKSAVLDIATALTRFGAVDEVFSALTPNRMLFQERTLSGTGVAGFVLDLDPLEGPSNIAAYAGPYQDTPAVRLAPYDLINDPNPAVHHAIYPRHALEALFNALVWFYFSQEFSDSGRGIICFRRSGLILRRRRSRGRAPSTIINGSSTSGGSSCSAGRRARGTAGARTCGRWRRSG
ncbi:hypothetical protein FB451DRAFT_1269018 [Mycena latifolia]|nr:hypothetical protein FB451DRAFT_1269018 [Mycena latifolia]